MAYIVKLTPQTPSTRRGHGIDVLQYVRSAQDIALPINKGKRHHLMMQHGDPVLVWRNDMGQLGSGGLIALGSVVNRPMKAADFPEPLPPELGVGQTGSIVRVRIDRVVDRPWLRWSDLERLFAGTSFWDHWDRCRTAKSYEITTDQYDQLCVPLANSDSDRSAR